MAIKATTSGTRSSAKTRPYRVENPRPGLNVGRGWGKLDSVYLPSEKQLARDAVVAACAAENAKDVIAAGDWRNFTRAEAIDWCWSLAQHEPQDRYGLHLLSRSAKEEGLLKHE